MSDLTVATLNVASGRGPDGRPLPADRLAEALSELARAGADVVCLQEVDVDQPRSARVHQAAVAAAAFGAEQWRYAPSLAGTPSPVRTWEPVPPCLLAEAEAPGPLFGNALLSRVPVRRWHVLPLGASRMRLPLRFPDPVTGMPLWWAIPDEPRVAVAAELDVGTVVGTHLSFWPVAAVRQLRLLRSWAASLPGPVVLAGDLNLPGPVPAAVLRGRRLVHGPTYPAAGPRVQLDHVVALGAVTAAAGQVRALPVGDHRAAVADLRL